MPAYLSEAKREYNHILRIQPGDPIGQLNYYQASSSSYGSQKSKAINKSSQLDSSKDQSNSLSSSTTDNDSCEASNCDRQKNVHQKSSASSYSARLVNLLLKRNRLDDDRATSSRSSLISETSAASASHTGTGLDVSSSVEQVLRIVRRQISQKLAPISKVNPINDKIKPYKKEKVSDSPQFESSGFSEETNIGTMKRSKQHKLDLSQGLTKSCLDSAIINGQRGSNDQDIDWALIYKIQRAVGILDQSGSSSAVSSSTKLKRGVNMLDSNHSEAGPKHGQQRTRLRRRKINRVNRRNLTTGTDMYGNPIMLESGGFSSNPYALGELFSQSEVPGFREIFSSDSYLRKFCWIVAFLFMTVLSLNDMTALITEFYEYPITVDVRLRDTARLPFPAVTVCNLNVVRYSGLCSSRFSKLADQIPSDLRDKLCGLQVDKKKNSTSGETANDATNLGGQIPRPPSQNDVLADINNIGRTTKVPPATTTTSTTTNVALETSQTSTQRTSSSSLASTNAQSASLPSSTPQQATSSTRRPSGSLDLGVDFKPQVSPLSDRLASQRKSSSRRQSRRSIDILQEDGRPFASSNWNRRVASIKPVLESDAHLANPMQSTVRNPVRSPSNQLHASNSGNWLVSPVTEYSTSFGNLPSLTQMAGVASNPHTVVTQPTTFSPPSSDDSDLTERQERELQQSLTNWLAVMYQHDSQLTRSLGHQFDDMILRCTMKSINCTRQSAFDWSFSPTEGNCFTYKSKTKRRNKKNNMQFTYEEANLAGPNDGLELVLNLEKSEYISGSSQVGALVMVHHPDELGYAASEATFIAPEFTTYIGLKMMNITRLPAPYPEYCVDSWPEKFQDSSNTIRNSTYSQQTCLKICLQKTIQAHCACQSAVLPIVEGMTSSADTSGGNESETTTSSDNDNNSGGGGGGGKLQQRVIICDTRKKQTRQCVRDVNLRAADRVHHCECPPKCQVVRYDKTISVARWPTREDKVSFDRGKMDVNFQNLAKVIVYFQTMTCEEVTQQAVFNAAKLFSALGGIMGMYVGFSFLSVFEIFEVVSRKFWHYARGRFGSSLWLLRDQQTSSFGK